METYFTLKKDEYFALVAKVFPDLDLSGKAGINEIEAIAIECFLDSWRLILQPEYTKVFIETKTILKHFRRTDTLKFRGE